MPDPRLDRPLGIYRLTRFLGEHPLGSLYALAGASEDCLLIFEGENVDPGADFDAYVAELEKLQGTECREIARVAAAGEIQGLRFRIAEPPRGESLAALLEERDGALPGEEATRILAAVARALAEAHGRGVAHGGLCPGVVRVEGRRVEVEDFGVSRIRRWRTTRRDLPTESPATEYAAPDANPRAPAAPDDVFALGVMAQVLFTGRAPGSPGRGLPPALAGLVEAMVGDRAHRPSAAVVVEVLAGRRSLLPRARLPERRPEHPRPTPQPSMPVRRRGPKIGSVFMGLGLILGGAATFVVLNHGRQPLFAGGLPVLVPERQVLTVDPENGPLRTVAAAVAAAQPGARILVPAGVHPGPVDIAIPLTLEGRPGAILQTAEHNTLRIAADVEVRGLTLRRTGARNRYTVRVRAGRAHFIDCTFQGAGGAVLAGTNTGVVVVERGSVIGGRAAAVFVTDHARATLTEVDVRQAGLSGIEAAGQAEVEVRRGRVHANEAAGILARESSRIDVEGVTFHGNGNAALSMKDDAAGTIRGNLLEFGRASGLHLRSRGEVRVEDNRILGHPLAGIEVSGGARPLIVRNLVRDGLGTGIFVHEGARPRIEDNRIGGNALAGIEVALGAEPEVRLNTIENSRGGGIFLHDGGNGTIEANEISASTRAGILVRDRGSNPRILSNTVRDGASGLAFLDGAEGLARGNRIHGNRLHGVEIHGAYPTLERNEIRENQGHGIAFFGGGGGILEGNQLAANGAGDLHLEGAEPGRLVRRGQPLAEPPPAEPDAAIIPPPADAAPRIAAPDAAIAVPSVPADAAVAAPAPPSGPGLDAAVAAPSTAPPEGPDAAAAAPATRPPDPDSTVAAPPSGPY